MSTKVGIFFQTGLGTDPRKDCCGARPHLELLNQKYCAGPQDLMIYAWDNGKSDVVWLDALEQYDILLASGHSLGAGEVMKKIDRHVTSQTRCKVVAGIIEDCPLEDVLTPLEPPREMSKAINYWVAVWQRNFQPMGRMFAPRSGGIARDLSEYTDAQGVLHKLGHSQGNPGPEFESIAGDAFVWQLIELSFLMQRSFKA